MQFRMRSKAQAARDLLGRLSQLPANHPDRQAIIRMIEGLQAELYREQEVRTRAANGEMRKSQHFIERRRTPRARTLLSAQIAFGDGAGSEHCHIVGLSQGGATLRSLGVLLCPTRFLLKSRFKPTRECELVWRKGELMGVRYV